MFDNLHAAAKLFIQHPLGNNKLIAARKSYLHLLAKGRTSPHDRDPLATMRMMRIVNHRRNMGSL